MVVDILGLGESLALYDNAENIRFGVNDIMKRVRVDYVVCVDKMDAFKAERLMDIMNHVNYLGFVSHLKEWEFMPDFYKIDLQKRYPGQVADLDLVAIPKSCFSPYVAVGLAWKMFKPTKIRFFGVDMINHPNLHNQTDRIKKDWRAMVLALAHKGCEVEVWGDGILKGNP